MSSLHKHPRQTTRSYQPERTHLSSPPYALSFSVRAFAFFVSFAFHKPRQALIHSTSTTRKTVPPKSRTEQKAILSSSLIDRCSTLEQWPECESGFHRREETKPICAKHSQHSFLFANPSEGPKRRPYPCHATSADVGHDSEQSDLCSHVRIFFFFEIVKNEDLQLHPFAHLSRYYACP